MIKIDKLIVKYHEEVVGTLSMTPDNKLCAFEYDKVWLVNGFSISPLEVESKIIELLQTSSSTVLVKNLQMIQV